MVRYYSGDSIGCLNLRQAAERQNNRADRERLSTTGPGRSILEEYSKPALSGVKVTPLPRGRGRRVGVLKKQTRKGGREGGREGAREQRRSGLKGRGESGSGHNVTHVFPSAAFPYFHGGYEQQKTSYRYRR